MKTFTLDVSTILFVAAVHAVGGVGLGLWLAPHVPLDRRRLLGFSLMALAVGLHVPMRSAVMRGQTAFDRAQLPS